MKLRGAMEDPGIAFGKVLFQSIQAGRLEQDQDATAESATHHARPDNGGTLGGELNEKIKLPAAYREIVSKTRMRRIQNAAEPSGRPSLQHGSGLENARVLADHVPRPAALDGVVDAFQVVLTGVTKAGNAKLPRRRLTLGPPVVVGG